MKVSGQIEIDGPFLSWWGVPRPPVGGEGVGDGWFHPGTNSTPLKNSEPFGSSVLCRNFSCGGGVVVNCESGFKNDKRGKEEEEEKGNGENYKGLREKEKDKSSEKSKQRSPAEYFLCVMIQRPSMVDGK
ncbi:hypothetical protein CEXT_539531 [Caerostris extrusa]|uniref:Uncharacterized protein n=1 Tax=Caerostris extrusa TaxID=172846 RepID=A0AAV4RMH5_CAEEX|nr:hypothetical protein CEXT_539531 [Caerostris extrusa]